MIKARISVVAAISFLIIASSSSTAFGYGSAPVQSSSGNYTVDLKFDKESYAVGDTILVSGNVNKYDQDRTLKITIFDSERNLMLNEKIEVNSDTSFSYEIVPDEEFSEGKYTVRAQYGSSKVTVEKTSFEITPGSAEISVNEKSAGGFNIPDWVRNNAAWWAEGSIDDNSFVQGIQFMIKEGLMRIS